MTHTITDEDRKLVQRWIALIYAEATLSDPRIDAEKFRLRQEMRRLGIKVDNVGRGQFVADVRGNELLSEWNVDMAKLRVKQLLADLSM